MRIRTTLFAALLAVIGLVGGGAHAQLAEFEVFRTEDTPGFVRIVVLPGPDAVGRAPQVVFARGFSPNEVADYEAVLAEIRQFPTAQVVTVAEAEAQLTDPTVIVLGLGQTGLDVPTFTASGVDAGVVRFNAFLDTHAPTEYFTQVTLGVGEEMLTDLYSVGTTPLRATGAEWVGRFTRDDTPLDLQLTVDQGEQTQVLQAQVDLTDPSFIDPAYSYVIPRQWQEIHDRKSKPLLDPFWQWVTPYFPYLLGGLALLFLLWLLYEISTNRRAHLHDSVAWLRYHPHPERAFGEPPLTPLLRFDGDTPKISRQRFLREHLLHRHHLGEYTPLDWIKRHK